MMKHVKTSLLLTTMLYLAVATTNSVAQPTISISDRVISKPTERGFGRVVNSRDFTSLTLRKGSLDCNLVGTCKVRNMPLLNQMDPRIDADVKANSPWGCYDTSIVTAAITALANRSTTNPLTGRTKVFSELLPDGTAPKEVKQISWQYRRVPLPPPIRISIPGAPRPTQSPQPFYLQELVATFGKINEGCDAYLYGNCTNTTNSFGHAFRYWPGEIGWKEWTDEDIVQYLNSGYSIIVAYGRFDPKADAVNQNFVKSSQHKVIFSGYRKNSKYPLLINDVGNGAQYWVRLSTDLAERDYKKPAKVPYKSKVFIEYEGAGLPASQVYFLEHLDGIRLK